jgi:hypothetical protein
VLRNALAGIWSSDAGTGPVSFSLNDTLNLPGARLLTLNPAGNAPPRSFPSRNSVSSRVNLLDPTGTPPAILFPARSNLLSRDRLNSPSGKHPARRFPRRNIPRSSAQRPTSAGIAPEIALNRREILRSAVRLPSVPKGIAPVSDLPGRRSCTTRVLEASHATPSHCPLQGVGEVGSHGRRRPAGSRASRSAVGRQVLRQTNGKQRGEERDHQADANDRSPRHRRHRCGG